MSGMLLRLVCSTAVTTSALLVPAPAAAAPDPAADPAVRPNTLPASPSRLLTDLQQLYRQAERATETYNATAEKLTKRQADVERLDGQLVRARLALQSSRGEVGRLARQQYQSSTGISAYVRLLLARDPQHALDEGHVIGQLTQDRAESVDQLTGDEKRADDLARKARKALDDQLTLEEQQKKAREDVQRRLADVEKMLSSLSAEQLDQLAEFERNGTATAQRELLASGSLGDDRPPSRAGGRALRYAVEQIGKPYRWGAEGPTAYDCSGLTSRAWGHAGRAIPRTSQEQWARLPHVPLKKLRPGDLVVYFPEATHVALYLGNGMVVQAPRPGTRVKVSPIAANPVLGAVRPDPAGKPLRRYAPPRLPRGAMTGPDKGYWAAAPETDVR
ncbi:NlpC/P60 family protein [Streptomyces yaanensis]|uniref:NlpC/P60 family protein n=1 Tax=Streptomyces yaanensis TaxID=1142239 RepID=A0ABV7SFC6_9ACTN|nr:NlpC/P60 family protein [Streptomyces sp. CGMCC 4.7035]WNB97745.1 NlpC/P60 family protein [Streptomyces sp. CGMCC 4.7035]